jgi:Tfp pilus assembly protein PilE
VNGKNLEQFVKKRMKSNRRIMEKTAEDQSNEMPEELKGLCWGAFWWGPVWGAFNSVWSSFLYFIPGVNIIMAFVLLFKGRQWAWENSLWKNEDHFKKIQWRWSLSGLLFCFGAIPIVAGIIAAVALPNFQKYQAKAKTSEAKLQLSTVYVAETGWQADNNTFTENLEEAGYVPSSSDLSFYKIGFASHGELFSKHCPDCRATKDGFMAVAIGNIDKDETLDVWTIDQDRNMVHLINDVKD